MTSKVFYMKTTKQSPDDMKRDSIEKLLSQINDTDIFRKDENIAVKVNLADVKNKGCTDPIYVEKLVKILKSYDTNTHLIDSKPLYQLDECEKYTYENTDVCQHILNDSEIKKVDVDGEIIKTAKLSKQIHNSDKIITLTQFKPHHICGIAGAIKNMAIDTAVKSGKIEQYRQAAPFISKIGCLACKVCINECPQKAVELNSIAQINYTKCIACNLCVRICPKDTVKINRIKSDFINKAICEYAKAATENRKNDIIYINFLDDIKADYEDTKQDDANEKLSDDIAILISNDPVAIDQASYDMLNDAIGEDIVEKLWRIIDAQMQLNYADSINVGCKDYELVEIK